MTLPQERTNAVDRGLFKPGFEHRYISVSAYEDLALTENFLKSPDEIDQDLLQHDDTNTSQGKAGMGLFVPLSVALVTGVMEDNP